METWACALSRVNPFATLAEQSKLARPMAAAPDQPINNRHRTVHKQEGKW
jgi:hypothetical protein